MSESTSQTFEFQAEIKQLLDIVIHSLYTEKEIFVRELVSNASDALEKLRHLQLTEKHIFDDRLPLEITITTDDTANTITIQDFGIGMTRDELIQNLGTIAQSGSKNFLQALTQSGEKNSNLIGQFGVGFYSAFMVADKVHVYSRPWQPDAEGHLWTSDGSGTYTVEPAPGQRRGTKIVIHLKEACKTFATASRIQTILRQYSAFVTFPIQLNGERVNTVEALWLRAKNAITDAEYNAFYQFQAHAMDEPRFRLHFSADAPLQIHALLFVPQTNTEKFGFERSEAIVSLYCRKILIDHAPKGLLPEWLRFLKGVVDSEDLPLNISRETMQDKALIDKLNRVLTKRFLRMLEEAATERPDDYLAFFKEFGIFLKEGAATDFTHRESLMKLLRFESSFTEPGKVTSLADYCARMPESQKAIYYLTGPHRTAIEQGPYLEGLRAHGFEVLFCFDAVDEYVMQNVREFDGKPLTNAERGDLDLPELATDQETSLPPETVDSLIAYLKETLGERISGVRPAKRLVDSPVAALIDDPLMTPHMRRMMRAMQPDQAPEPVKVLLEINPRHPVIHHLAHLQTAAPDRAVLVAGQLLDNALIAAGLLEDPMMMLQRLNKLLATC